MPTLQQQSRGSTNAPSQQRSACRHPRISQQRRLLAAPLNVAAGSRSGPKQLSSQLTSSPTSTLKTTSSSLPVMLAGLSGGALLGAFAMHLCNPDHETLTATSAAASAIADLKEFGPADFVAQNFGPTRPLWALMLHSQHAAASSHHSIATAASATASAASASGDGSGAPLLQGAAEDAAAAVRGAVGKVCDGYNRWLEESPLLCKIVTGNFFTVAGDMLAQLGLGGAGGHGDVGGGEGTAAAAPGGKKRVDWMRTGRLCLETSAFGTPAGHWWFGLLDSTIMPENPHCPTAVVTKMLADQIIFAPFGLLVFFAIIKCLEGRPRDIPQTIKTSYVRTLLGGYLLWPAAGLLNFALLPSEYRLLFNNCVNILWTCFLSIMSSSDANPNSPSDTPAAANSSGCVAASTTTTAVATPAPQAPSAPAPAPSFHSVPSVAAGISHTDLAVAAVAAAAIGASATDRPAFGYVTGIAVAAIEVALTRGSAEPEAVETRHDTR